MSTDSAGADFGTYLKECLDKVGLKQKDLADELGVSKAAVTKWVNGNTPDIKRIPEIARLLGVNPSELLEKMANVPLEIEPNTEQDVASNAPTNEQLPVRRSGRVREWIICSVQDITGDFSGDSVSWMDGKKFRVFSTRERVMEFIEKHCSDYCAMIEAPKSEKEKIIREKGPGWNLYPGDDFFEFCFDESFKEYRPKKMPAKPRNELFDWLKSEVKKEYKRIITERLKYDVLQKIGCADDFDAWHKETCNALIEAEKQVFEFGSGAFSELYGGEVEGFYLAQRVLNTFLSLMNYYNCLDRHIRKEYLHSVLKRDLIEKKPNYDFYLYVQKTQAESKRFASRADYYTAQRDAENKAKKKKALCDYLSSYEYREYLDGLGDDDHKAEYKSAYETKYKIDEATRLFKNHLGELLVSYFDLDCSPEEERKILAASRCEKTGAELKEARSKAKRDFDCGPRAAVELWLRERFYHFYFKEDCSTRDLKIPRVADYKAAAIELLRAVYGEPEIGLGGAFTSLESARSRFGTLVCSAYWHLFRKELDGSQKLTLKDERVAEELVEKAEDGSVDFLKSFEKLKPEIIGILNSLPKIPCNLL